MSTKHEPTPYSLFGKQGTAIWSKNKIVAQMYHPREGWKQARADAEFIVLACNSFYGLIEALEELKNAGECYCMELKKSNLPCMYCKAQDLIDKAVEQRS